MAYTPTELDSPFARLGGEEPVRRLAESLLRSDGRHRAGAGARCTNSTQQGRVSRRSRDNFALFLIEWLGGPRNFSATRGHPRLRMRHGRVAIGEGMRDAWLRCMARALDEQGVSGDVRGFLDARFAEVANFLRNVPE